MKEIVIVVVVIVMVVRLGFIPLVRNSAALTIDIPDNVFQFHACSRSGDVHACFFQFNSLHALRMMHNHGLPDSASCRVSEDRPTIVASV